MSSSQFSSTCAWDENPCTTKFKTHEVVFSWMVENFDFHETNGEYLESPKFSAITNDKYNWYLSLRPNGDKDSTTEENISIYLYLTFTESLQSTFAKFTIKFFKQEQEVKSYMAAAREFTSEKNSWGWKNIPKELVLSDNEVKIRCHVTFSQRNDVFSNFAFQYKLETPECNLSENFASLLENREFSDVTISIKSKTYPVHKCVLAARSPVFAAMFRHDTKENRLNRVIIDDIDGNVMDEMLRYIYTGTCENLDSLVEGLLAAADKYAIDGLKIMCSRKLQENLSVENAANILLLSEMHRVGDLKERAIRFIVDKSREVFDTAGWKNIVSSSPQLMIIDEVCRAVALR